MGDNDLATAAEVVRTVVGEDSTVSVDAKGKRLLVLTTAEKQRQVAEMVAKLNPPARNIRIEVRFKGSGRTEAQEASLGASGNVIIGPGGKVNTKIQLNPKLVNESSTRSSDTTQLLLVSSGREARLQVGEEVPYLDWVMEYGLSHGWTESRVVWKKVGSALVVEPTLIGEGPDIRIKITPELSGMVDGNPQRIRFAQAATEIIGRDGQPLELGGWGDNREFYDRFLVGLRSGGQKETLSIMLTPHVMPAGRPPGPVEQR